LVAAGANEPAKRPVYESAVRINNRRVEIIVRESLIDDYAGQSPPNKSANKQLTKQPADLPTTKW
jgi:hypothetical protein